MKRTETFNSLVFGRDSVDALTLDLIRSGGPISTDELLREFATLRKLNSVDAEASAESIKAAIWRHTGAGRIRQVAGGWEYVISNWRMPATAEEIRRQTNDETGERWCLRTICRDLETLELIDFVERVPQDAVGKAARFRLLGEHPLLASSRTKGKLCAIEVAGEDAPRMPPVDIASACIAQSSPVLGGRE